MTINEFVIRNWLTLVGDAASSYTAAYDSDSVMEPGANTHQNSGDETVLSERKFEINHCGEHHLATLH
jgi:hypothetical protein